MNEDIPILGLSAAKCSLGIAVSTEVRFMRIFPGVRWGGASNEGGVSFFGDFRPIHVYRNISKTVHSRI